MQNDPLYDHSHEPSLRDQHWAATVKGIKDGLIIVVALLGMAIISLIL